MIWDELSYTAAGGEMIWYSQTSGKISFFHVQSMYGHIHTYIHTCTHARKHAHTNRDVPIVISVSVPISRGEANMPA